MAARWLSLLVWIGVAAAAAGWALQIFGQDLTRPAHTSLAQPQRRVNPDFTRWFGSPPPAPMAAVEEAPAEPAADRFQLVGVVYRGPSGGGMALIASDGQAARAIAVGRELEPGLRLASVTRRGAELVGEDRQRIQLRLPDPPQAQRGVPGAARPGAAGASGPGAGLTAGRIAMPVFPGASLGLPQPGAAATGGAQGTAAQGPSEDQLIAVPTPPPGAVQPGQAGPMQPQVPPSMQMPVRRPPLDPPAQ